MKAAGSRSRTEKERLSFDRMTRAVSQENELKNAGCQAGAYSVGQDKSRRRSRQREAKMIETCSASKESDLRTRSAEETVNFLNENFGPDECDRLALIATLIGKAVYETEPNDVLFRSAVFARRERRMLSEATRCELQALLDESASWPGKLPCQHTGDASGSCDERAAPVELSDH
jgi:hypothetical protein